MVRHNDFIHQCRAMELVIMFRMHIKHMLILIFLVTFLVL